MQNPEDFDVDSLLKQFDDLQNLDAQAVIERRKKLKEQILDKTPQVVLQRLDLKCLIMKVKQSLSEFQRRIDESVTQQQLRRTTRARRPVRRDSEVVSFFNERIDLPSNTHKGISTQTCKDSICCQHVSEVCGLVQVECLPVSASTNLITIFVPSILQEKLHSCKYKISIDLNRLDLTKKILDLNVEQHIHSGLETAPKPTSSDGIEIQVDQAAGENDQSCRVTYEFKSNGNGENVVELVNTNAPDAKGKTSKTNANPTDCIGCSEHSRPSTSAGADGTISLTGERKPRQKRKITKSPNKNPPKKRGRKPGSKNKNSEKSEIAKYVETFACLASPSAVSQIVSSTTQPDEGTSIAYFMNGAWTLTAPTAEGPCQMVTTTNETVNLDDATVGGQDTFIPFEDFVNFIENPSIDAGSNVIARVLDGTIDNADCNTQEFHIPQQSEGNQNVNSLQQNSSEKGPETYTTTILNPATMGHNNSTNIISNMPDQIIAGEVLNLSCKEQSTAKTLGSPCQTNSEKNIVNDPFIFGTDPSMPSLDDDMEGDLFCSPSQQSKQSIVFSTAPRISPASTHDSSHKSTSKTEEGSLADSAIEVLDYSKHAPASIKNKTKAEVMQGMSLLEIENDIDDSLLDFDNCLDDDLLSLAPSSCFNTPNDDRFGDSKFLDADKLDTTPPKNVDKIDKSLTPAPRSRLEQSLIKMNEEESSSSPALKSFKIPRVRSSNNETVDNLSPVKPTVTRALPPTDGENKSVAYTYRLSPVSASKSMIQMSSSSTTNDFTEMVSTREISKMFGSLCYGFLADKCFNTNCKFSHRLLELSVIITSLSLFRNEVLHCAYRFIWRHHKLFKFYFPIFCEEYARRNMRNKLSSMINDCIMQPNCLPYLRNIYSVLLGNGLNRVNACRFILNRVKDRSPAVVDILLEIVIEAGASMFNREIEQFSQITSYKFRMTDINGMASACLCSGSAELVTVLIKCLMCVDQTEFMTMRSPELIQVLEMIRNGGFEGL